MLKRLKTKREATKVVVLCISKINSFIISVYSFIVKLHCLMTTVTALLKLLTALIFDHLC